MQLLKCSGEHSVSFKLAYHSKIKFIHFCILIMPYSGGQRGGHVSPFAPPHDEKGLGWNPVWLVLCTRQPGPPLNDTKGVVEYNREEIVGVETSSLIERENL